jgi:hypothetical protein
MLRDPEGKIILIWAFTQILVGTHGAPRTSTAPS